MNLLTETSLSGVLGAFFVAGAGVGCLYLLIASLALLRFGQGRKQVRESNPPVTILKPLHGDEPELLPRLVSFCTQNYSGPVQVVFGTQDPSDRANAVIDRLQSALPDRPIELKIDARGHGSNRKISNVINMSALAHHPVVVLADSDIEVGPDYLSAVVGELQNPNVGVVTCLYHGTARIGFWSQLSRLAIDTHFLPNAVTAIGLGLARPCFGSTIAMRSEVLKRIGGFQAFADCLADDYAIGAAVHEAGYEIAVPAFSVGHACHQRSAADVIKHDLRAARTVKNIDPVGHLGTIITHPLPLALLGMLLGSADAVLMVAMAITCRIALCVCVERAFQLERHPYWLLPVRDVMSFGVFVASFFGNSVNWRGYNYQVLSDGTMTQESKPVQP